MDKTSLNPAKRNRLLIGTGILFLVFGAAVTCRIVWEETFLTWKQGPQMVGFSLAHRYYAPLLFAPILVFGWLIVALIIAIVNRVKRFGFNKALLTIMAFSILILSTLSAPETFWQWIFIGSFAKSPHAAELMTYDAALGAATTVRGYLDRNVPIESRNYEGSTAAFTAAAGGSVDVLRLVADRGADLNAINSYGDSPLQAATDNKHPAAVQFLREHGAKLIAGTPEQRDAAAKAIVDKQIEEEDKSSHYY